ncbi:hypothetical protein [Deminuibacter soli]|uniref:Uncharacterized protein n=1 Tax=Deminuibacter soli TaxID=2291815 RepID=A0A3E1NQ85_9BACT|nr:hypothetical protein [Deminuibacter soli]RFM30067.1 hypothetical protein DXN05_03585 [Deminuibacter soli]
MIIKSRRKNNKDLTPAEQDKLRQLTQPYGCLVYASQQTGIIPDTIRNILTRGAGKAEYVDKIRSFIIAETKVLPVIGTHNTP